MGHSVMIVSRRLVVAHGGRVTPVYVMMRRRWAVVVADGRRGGWMGKHLGEVMMVRGVQLHYGLRVFVHLAVLVEDVRRVVLRLRGFFFLSAPRRRRFVHVDHVTVA